MEYAGKKLKKLTSSGKSILWVGTKKPAQAIIEKAAKDLNMPFVVNRWIGGTLSNYAQVKKAITRLLHLRDILKKPATFYKKKELVMLQKQLARLERNVGGIIDLEFPPAAIVVVDAKKEHSAVKEAFGTKIPVIALVDTNTDPSFVSCVIPGNDDSPKSINLVIEYLVKYAADGQKVAKETKKAKLEEEAAKKKSAPEKPEKKQAEPKAEVKAKEVKKEIKEEAKKPVAKKTTKKTVVKKKVEIAKSATKKTVKKTVKKVARKAITKNTATKKTVSKKKAASK